MYSVVNMGHGYPKILAAAVKAMTEGAVVNLLFQSLYYGKLVRKLHDVGLAILIAHPFILISRIHLYLACESGMTLRTLTQDEIKAIRLR
jgi:hypothetical protein